MVEQDSRGRWPATLLVDPRVVHRWDAAAVVGRAYFSALPRLTLRRVAESLPPDGPVLWDAWLLYPADARWGAQPPAPASWGYTIMHTKESLRRETLRLAARTAPAR